MFVCMCVCMLFVCFFPLLCSTHPIQPNHTQRDTHTHGHRPKNVKYPPFHLPPLAFSLSLHLERRNQGGHHLVEQARATVQHQFLHLLLRREVCGGSGLGGWSIELGGGWWWVRVEGLVDRRSVIATHTDDDCDRRCLQSRSQSGRDPKNVTIPKPTTNDDPERGGFTKWKEKLHIPPKSPPLTGGATHHHTWFYILCVRIYMYVC